MDARTSKKSNTISDDHVVLEGDSAKRDRLLASLNLIGGIGLLIAFPFALRAGAEFFLPVTAALVIAIALVPMLEWFERRGVPSKIASALCVVIFLLIAIFAIGSIVLPAIDWVARVPERIGKVRDALEPVLDLYNTFERFIDRTVSQIAVAEEAGRTVRLETPNSMLGLLTASAPHAMIQLFFALSGDLLLPLRLDRDAQADDRQPRQLRRRADDRAGDPAGGGRHLDLSRHDHRHQCHLGRAHCGDPVATRHGFAADVGRHRRGAELTFPTSGRSPRRCCCSSAG